MHTEHWTQHTAHSTQQTANSTQYTAQCKYYTTHWTHCIMQTLKCTVHSAYCILHTARCLLHTPLSVHGLSWQCLGAAVCLDILARLFADWSQAHKHTAQCLVLNNAQCTTLNNAQYWTMHNIAQWTTLYNSQRCTKCTPLHNAQDCRALHNVQNCTFPSWLLPSPKHCGSSSLLWWFLYSCRFVEGSGFVFVSAGYSHNFYLSFPVTSELCKKTKSCRL